jgi:hypothetical protein
MKKPTTKPAITLAPRRPSPDPAEATRFIAGGGAQAPTRPGAGQVDDRARLHVRLPAALHRRLSIYALERGEEMGHVVERALEALFASERK